MCMPVLVCVSVYLSMCFICICAYLYGLYVRICIGIYVCVHIDALLLVQMHLLCMIVHVELSAISRDLPGILNWKLW